MSLHNFREHWQVWLLDSSFMPITRIESELAEFHLEWLKRDECSFTCSIPLSSQFYPLLDTTQDQFLLVARLDKWQVFAIESIELAYNPRTGQRDMAHLAGKGGNAYFLDTRICQPSAGYGDELGQQFNGKLDDVIKDFVRYNLEPGTAFNDPLGNPRGLAGLTVAAKKSEHETQATIFRKGNLWEVLRELAQAYDIDMVWMPIWNGPDAAVTFVFETYVPTRGIDRSPGSAHPVVLSDVYQVFSKSSWHCNNYPLRTHGYLNDGLTVVENPDATGRIRKEVLLNTDDSMEIKEALEDMRPEQGHTFDFIESAAFQLGRDFWLGDTIPHYDKHLDTPIKVEQLTGIKISIQQDGIGSEKIELVFGDPKPTITKNQNSGGTRRRLPGGDAVPSQTPWAAGGKIQPVASTNVAGTAMAIPHADHQHRAVLVSNDGTAVGPTSTGAFYILGGDGCITSSDSETNSIYIDVTGTPWGLRDDSMTLVSPAGDSTIQITGHSGYTVTGGTAVLTVLGPWFREATTAVLYPRTSTDKVAINRTNCDGGNTWLDVNGNVRVNNYLYASENTLNIFGKGGQVNVVDFSNACVLYIYNGATPKVLLHSHSSSLFRGGGIHIENGHDLQLETGEGGSNITGYWAGSNGAIAIFGGGNFSIQPGGVYKAIIHGDTGNLWLADAATTKFGGYTYTWPTSGAGANKYLKATGTGTTLAWVSASELAGALSHSDLLNLSADDHTQYLNNARHEALTSNLHYGKAAVSASEPGTSFEGMLWVDTDEEGPIVSEGHDLWFMM